MKTIIYSLLVLGLFTIFSCSIEKRLYNKGYNVSWNKKFKGSENITGKNTENAVLRPDQECIEDAAQPLVQESIPAAVSHQPDSREDQVQVSKPAHLSYHAPTLQNEKKGSFRPKNMIKKLRESKVIKRDSGSSHPGRALILLIFALVFVVLGFVFIANLGAVGLIFGTIFFIGAALMLIASIIYFIL